METRFNDNLTKRKCNSSTARAHVLSVCDYVCCAFLALALSTSSYYTKSGSCPLTLALILTSLVVFVALIFATYLIRKFLISKSLHSNRYSRFKVCAFAELLLNCKHPVLAVAALILVCWAIPIIFLYPGTCINDTWNQLHQYITSLADEAPDASGGLNDHHPIFDTLLIGTLIVPLAQATGLWHPFMFLYVLLQAICTSLAFSCTVNYAYKKLKLGIIPTVIILAMFCCLQVFPAMVQLISKDSLHSWIFVFYALFFVELVRTDGKAIKDKKFIALFCVTIVFCCLTKKVGFYVVLFSLLLFLIFCKNNRKFVLIPIFCAFFLMQVVMPLVLSGGGITQIHQREMFSLPFQMTARYVKDNPDDISESEREIIDKTLEIDNLAERYNPVFADPVKGSCNISSVEEFVDYFKVWVKQGLRHPKSYITATNCLVTGWFSWDEWAPLMDNGWRNQFVAGEIPEDVPERGISQGTASAYQEMVHNLYKCPLLTIFHTWAFWASLVTSFILCTVIRCRKTHKHCWLAFLPMLFALILGCWLAPVSNYGIEGIRYLFPVVSAAPLLIAWCFYVTKKPRNNAGRVTKKSRNNAGRVTKRSQPVQ